MIAKQLEVTGELHPSRPLHDRCPPLSSCGLRLAHELGERLSPSFPIFTAVVGFSCLTKGTA